MNMGETFDVYIAKLGGIRKACLDFLHGRMPLEVETEFAHKISHDSLVAIAISELAEILARTAVRPADEAGAQ